MKPMMTISSRGREEEEQSGDEVMSDESPSDLVDNWQKQPAWWQPNMEPVNDGAFPLILGHFVSPSGPTGPDFEMIGL